MTSEEDEISGSRPRTETTGAATEAAKPSTDSTDPSSRRRGSTRRITRAVVSGESRARTECPVRVLRARGAGAGRISESKNDTCKIKPPSLHRGRGRPVGSRCKDTPGVQAAIKKSTAKKASKHTLGPKLSKCRKVKGKSPAQASRTTSAAACKTEVEMDASLCGEETGASKGSKHNVADPDAALCEDPSVGDDPNDLICKSEMKMGKSRWHVTLQQKEVKKEDSEKEEEENDTKIRQSAKVAMQSGTDDNTESPRKRGRQHKDDKGPRLPKRRKKPPVQYVRCEMEGCGTVLAHPRYLQHHIKYQHLLKKKYVCDHPSCGRLFRLQKQLLRHAKHHTDQRDYICEYCARAFKSSHNLAVHRMIHTGEKPIQCEICGFTCRQKASLNWHMKKHDAEASYQFSCSICGKKFEKKDSVVAHKAKSHPEVLIAEALAANGGSVKSCPTPIPETVPVLTQLDQPSVSQEIQEVVSGTLTPLQQVVLPLAPETQIDVTQSQFLQLPTHHVVQVAQQQQAPTLLHLTTASPAQLSNNSLPQLTQLPSIPACTVTSMSTANPQSTLFTLSTVTPLASAASLASPQAVQWGKETHQDAQLPGEGTLWDRVVVGEGHQNVREMMWEGNGERRKEDEGIVWERDGERQVLLQCAEAHGDSLM
uniref:E3 ubiquitin-protein ligase ZFP91-like n=1 Tax=Scatophagus argus TaxID=75038 RepID=UPI001ED83792|nr:E3 ubiquitin-protein ligase ZFP91-like [Scatophagus argus]